MPDPARRAPHDGDALGTDLDRSPRPRVVGPLTARLALAFLAVALGALALFSILMLVATTREVADLARRQQDQTAADVAQAAGVAYATAEGNGVGWDGAHLETLRALAHLGGGEVVVLDDSGRAVEGSPQKRSPGRGVRQQVPASLPPSTTTSCASSRSSKTSRRWLRPTRRDSFLSPDPWTWPTSPPGLSPCCAPASKQRISAWRQA